MVKSRPKIKKYARPNKQWSSTKRVDQIGSESSHHPALKKASKTLEKSTKTSQNAVEVGMSLIGTGSGKAPLLLPATAATMAPPHWQAASGQSSSWTLNSRHCSPFCHTILTIASQISCIEYYLSTKTNCQCPTSRWDTNSDPGPPSVSALRVSRAMSQRPILRQDLDRWHHDPPSLMGSNKSNRPSLRPFGGGCK